VFYLKVNALLFNFDGAFVAVASKGRALCFEGTGGRKIAAEENCFFLPFLLSPK
jgi:hypothetical protein